LRLGVRAALATVTPAGLARHSYLTSGCPWAVGGAGAGDKPNRETAAAVDFPRDTAYY